MNTLWVCSLLVIPPPIGRTVPQGGFPSNLTELNLLGWADLVQDVVVGLQALLPRLCLNLGTQAIALLQLLEAATGVGFCCHCCHPRPHCTCTGASQLAPPMSWSQIVQQTQGYGVTSTSGGVTDMSIPMGGMPGYVVPPPGLTPPDFSIWSIPPPEVPPPPGLPASPLHRPPVGRASLLRAAVNQQAQMLQTPGSQAQALRATAPQAPTPLALKLLAPLPQAPQMVPPLCQPLPSSGSRPATPYQQAVQPPVKPKGRGVTFDTSADKVAAVGGHGRQRTHNRDNKTWPASPGRGAHKKSSVRTTGKQMPPQVSEHPSGTTHDALRDPTLGSTSHQCSSSTRAPKDPLRCVAQFWSQGWKKDLECIFRAYYEYNFTSLKEARWNKIRDKVFDHLLPCQEEWRRIKENDALQYMPYMEEQFYAATGIRLEGLAGCTAWIKHGSYYHNMVVQRGQLDRCPHLAGIEPPRGPQMTPSESRLVSQRKLDTLATSSSAPATEASAPKGATADVTAPMETGGAGDGCSWAEQTEDEDDFKRCRPAKHPQSQSRRCENRPTYPFPLQDQEGRCTSAQEIYRHSGQQLPARHNAATMGITYVHPEVLL